MLDLLYAARDLLVVDEVWIDNFTFRLHYKVRGCANITNITVYYIVLHSIM